MRSCETVLVFPKSTGAFVTIVKSPLNVIPSRQICVVDAVEQFPGFDIGCGLVCHTAKVPVSDVLWVAMYALKSAIAVLDWFDPHVPPGRIALEVERVGRCCRVVVRIEDERRERHGSGRGGRHARRARGLLR